ncbi:MAG: ECF transporter S component [Clostridiales bacterium]|nr:ECF transporter S component [Clostridiales bacterium]
MEKRRLMVRRLTYGGLLAAMVVVLTAVLRIPNPFTGYAHVGDGAVVLCGLMLGPYGALPAAVGSALADILVSMPQYALASAIVKGVMAWVVGRAMIVEERISVRNVLVLLAVFAWMVVAYFLFNSVYLKLAGNYPSYGQSLLAALGAVVYDLIQAGIGIVISLTLLGAGQRFLKKRLR